MMWRIVCSLVLGVCLGGVARTEESGAAVKQEVEDIFRTVERFMSQKVKPVEKSDSKSVEARVKEKIYVDHRDSGELDDVDELPVSPRILPTSGEVGLQPAAFPIGIIMADNLYPLVVGKNVDSGKPFVMNLNKEHALVVAKSAAGGDYKLLIPFPVMVGSHPEPENDDDVPRPGYRNSPTVGLYPGVHPGHQPMQYRTRSPLRGPSPVDGPSKLRSYDLGGEAVYRPREYAQHHQTYRQYSGEEPESGEGRVDKRPLPGKKYLKPQPLKNVKHRPDKLLNPPFVERPGTAVRGYDGVYSRHGMSYAAAGPRLNPRGNVPLAYIQPQLQHRRPVYNQYASTAPAYPYHPSYPATPSPAHKPALYPPVNYAGAYASVPKDFKPSPYLGNITDGPEHHDSGRAPKPQSNHYESYDDRPYDFTEQDYLDSLDSPGAYASIGGVHHVTHHADDYLGKIYEEMYYRMPPPPPPHQPHQTHQPPSDIDRQGNQEFLSVSHDVKVASYHSPNKTETSRPKNVGYQEVRQISMGTNKPNVKNR